MLQQWNMEGVKFYWLCNNLVRISFIEKLKRYMKEECKNYRFMSNLLM